MIGGHPGGATSDLPVMEPPSVCSTDSAVTARQNGRGASTPMEGAAMEHTGGDHGLPPPPPRKRWKVPASIPGDANVSTEPNDAMESERRGAHSRDDEAHVASAIDIDTTRVLEPCAAAPPALQPRASCTCARSCVGSRVHCCCCPRAAEGDVLRRRRKAQTLGH